MRIKRLAYFAVSAILTVGSFVMLNGNKIASNFVSKTAKIDIQQKNEQSALILEQSSNFNDLIAAHGSHVSHGSHGSHGSHSSHYSSR